MVEINLEMAKVCTAFGSVGPQLVTILMTRTRTARIIA
jgi:hypothetical protein